MKVILSFLYLRAYLSFCLINDIKKLCVSLDKDIQSYINIKMFLELLSSILFSTSLTLVEIPIDVIKIFIET